MSKKQNFQTIAFYNVENLFDTIDDPNTFDNDFTPEGKLNWDEEKYETKLNKIGSVISQLGIDENQNRPAIIGLVEVENEKVVTDLLNSRSLKHLNYDFVHEESTDERGIDVAFLYNKEVFEVLSSEHFPLYLEDEFGERDFTRDILVVSGNLNGEIIHFLINHWPSRGEGTEISEPKRILASTLAREIVENIQSRFFEPKIILMGDFNDDPTDKSLEFLVKDDFYNPMEKLLQIEYHGSLVHEKKWNLFDQIIFSKNFLEAETDKHQFVKASIFDKDWMKVSRGKLKGSPFRTYIHKWYQGGFSDHFPVYAFLEKN